MSNTTKNIAYAVAQELVPITLVLTPEFAQVLSGEPVSFSTQGSSSYDGSTITVTWELNTPIGAATSTLDITSDTLNAKLYPDVNGVYEVKATASNESGALSVKSAYIMVTSSSIPLSRPEYDASYIGDSIGSFWSILSNKEVLKSLWAEYVKALSGDYRKAAEVVLSKSIDTIQPGRTVSNYIIKPELDVSSYKHSVRVVESLCGTKTATTTIKNFLFHAVVRSSQLVELLLVGNKLLTGITKDARLHIYSSNTNIGGQYTIESTSSTAIRLSTKTPVLSTTKTASVSVTFTLNSDRVHSTTTLLQGSYLLLRGSFVEVTESSDSSGFATIARKAIRTQTKTVEIHTPVVVSIEPVELGLTNVVYVPAEELGGFNKFLPEDRRKTLEFVNKQTILVPFDMGITDVGATITVASTSLTGIKTKIVSHQFDNETGLSTFTVYPSIPADISKFNPSLKLHCRVKKGMALKGVLLTIGATSCPILDVSYFKNYSGYAYAAVRLLDSCFASNTVNLDWRISSTITSTGIVSSVDYDKEGVSPGDLLALEVSTSITNKRTNLDCTVIGAYKNKLSFEPTVKELVDAADQLLKPSIVDSAVAAAFLELQIPNVYTKSDNTFLFTSLAKSIYDAILPTINLIYYTDIALSTFSVDTSSTDNTIYVTNTTYNDSLLRVGLTIKSVIRNTKLPIKVDESIASIPSLTEFLYEKVTSEVENSDLFALLSKDGTVTYRKSKEVRLLENVSFFIKNRTKFTGNSLQKTSGLTLIDNHGFFTYRGVSPGDVIVIDTVSYTIKAVLNDTTIEIVKDVNTNPIQNKSFTNKSYYIKNPNVYSYPYLAFKAGLFNPQNPVPTRLFAKTIVVDNTKQVQNNFGVLVGYSIKDFYDYSSPQMSYLNAIKGLMFALTRGPTVRSIQLATAILLNLPVSQRTSLILDIDSSNGRFVLQPIDELTGAPDTNRGPEYYTFSTKETVEPFKGVGNNPITGKAFSIGDIVPRFTPLTSKVYVEDFTKKPFTSLDQFHKWNIYIDTNSISSRDLPHLAKFYSAAKPIHTMPTIELVLFLVTNVGVKVTITLEGTLKFYDDPALGLELTHSFDSNNSSGQVLRLTDKGELSTRTLFLGKDLITPSTTTITSARGGFLLNSPDDFTDDTGIAVGYDVKEINAMAPFSGTHFVKGKNLVRAGDILRVYDGVNAGIYSITQVNSNTQLTISPLSGYGIYTRVPEISNVASTFGIYRLVTDKIVEDVVCTSVSGDESTFTGATFNWDGVSVGDKLVDSTNHTVQHTILDIEYDPITEDAAVTLTTDTAPTQGDTFFIYRPLLISKEYASGQVTSYSALDRRHVVHNVTDQYKIEVGDRFVLTNGSFPEKYSVVTRIQNGSFEIAHDLSLSTSSTFSLQKLGRPLEDNSDSRLELLHGYDDVYVSLTSATAIATATAIASTASGIAVKEISGLNSLPEPCDKIYLYDASNVLVFEGTVYYQNSSSIVCFSDLDSIVNHSIAYKIKIERRSRA